MSQFRATFGMQCFWGAEALFGSQPGVMTTRVGYAGGTKSSPTYRNLGDHIETVDIQFNDETTFKDLLRFFFKSHNPTVKYKRQYISAVLYHDEIQKATVESFLKEISKDYSKQIVTEIIPFVEFTDAEDYHQKYFLRKNDKILKELNLNNKQIITSPLSCKLNAFCAGLGSIEMLKSFNNFNLSDNSVKMIENIIRQGPSMAECGI